MRAVIRWGKLKSCNERTNFILISNISIEKLTSLMMIRRDQISKSQNSYRINNRIRMFIQNMGLKEIFLKEGPIEKIDLGWQG